MNGELHVGQLHKTITVSGASPLVDTTNVRKQTVLERELLDALPIATMHVNTISTLTPGSSVVLLTKTTPSSSAANQSGR